MDWDSFIKEENENMNIDDSVENIGINITLADVKEVKEEAEETEDPLLLIPGQCYYFIACIVQRWMVGAEDQTRVFQIIQEGKLTFLTIVFLEHENSIHCEMVYLFNI